MMRTLLARWRDELGSTPLWAGAALLAAAGGAIGISIPAMGINSLLTEAPVRWNGGAGGAPKL